ncbi:2-amino-4-hydroxy-6-hydroxymethyldihydropteridine diphosphokinase [Phaeobacter sp.]|uniref:2-amino-4-hydroxy-6- hydroxymethyldihydropteridine diphosphokinase n=1 Tax=Phaeobacter sp. TaxID=1902409 RepID=UPI0025D552F7|nr:2-amino-4-hydroxy-6-hydroxymethyldihydropteridine diphosphokinase [Phaeobacter sp.]
MSEFRSMALIALGGNLPIGEQTVVRSLIGAIELLCESEVQLTAVSRFYQTPCFPAGAGPDFVNAAIAVGTNLEADALLAKLHDIEASFARKREQRWGTRTLDLDLIAYDAVVRPDRDGFLAWKDLSLDQQMSDAPEQLILPHPRIQDRAFVLAPLRDIAADWCHPVLDQTVDEMCKALPKDEFAAVSPL